MFQGVRLEQRRGVVDGGAETGTAQILETERQVGAVDCLEDFRQS